MKSYIGLDAHSATSTFVVVNGNGVEISKTQLATTEKNLVGFLKDLKGEKYLTFEETNLSKWLWLLLKDEVNELVVCNPSYLGSRQGPKNDYRDALHMANQLRCNNLTPVFHVDNEFIQMRSLIYSYLDLVREVVRSKNRFKSLFRSFGLETKGQSIYKSPQRIGELKNKSDQFVAQYLYEHICFLEEKKKSYVKEFRTLFKKHSQIKALTSIPGIDIIRAMTIAATICSAHRFETKHKLWAYSMLVKYDQESDGKSYGKKRVPGNRYLKCVYMGAAESALMGKSGLRKYYDELRLKGTAHKRAKKNLARHIAAISLVLLKNNEKYKDKYEEVNNSVKKKVTR